MALIRIQRQRLPVSFTSSPMTTQSLEALLAKRLLDGGEDILTNEPHFRSTTGSKVAFCWDHRCMWRWQIEIELSRNEMRTIKLTA